METTESIISDIKKLLKEPRTTEEIQSLLGADYELDLSVAQQYYLIQMTLMAYLGYLYDSKQVEIKLEDNLLYWSILDG